MEEKGDAAANHRSRLGRGGEEGRGWCAPEAGRRRGGGGRCVREGFEARVERREKGDTTIVERPAAPATSHHGYHTDARRLTTTTPVTATTDVLMVHGLRGLGTVHPPTCTVYTMIPATVLRSSLCPRTCACTRVYAIAAVPTASRRPETLAFLTCVLARIYSHTPRAARRAVPLSVRRSLAR